MTRILTKILLPVIFSCLCLPASAAGDNPCHTSPDSLPPINAEIIHQTLSQDIKAKFPDAPQIAPLPRYRERNWWLNRLKHHTLNLQDTSVIYPKFLGFCVDVYNWGDEFFNGTDHDYVVGTGKRWKARLVNENWSDGYGMTLPGNFNIAMLSNLYANLGAYLQYMAVSIGYSYDMSTLFGSDPLEHKKFEFGFNCARFNIEVYRQQNNGGTNIKKFGHYFKGRNLNIPFKGIDMMVQGVNFVYFLNHRRYSHGAAYNFSKFQKRSQGSPIVGLAYTDVNLDMDFSKLPGDLITRLTVPAWRYRLHYDSYCIVGGYGYNWVITPKLLFNITATPSLGATHCFPDNLEGEKWMFAMNLGGQSSITYNFGNWFLCGMAKFSGHWYKSGNFSLLNSILNFSGNLGIRF